MVHLNQNVFILKFGLSCHGLTMDVFSCTQYYVLPIYWFSNVIVVPIHCTCIICVRSHIKLLVNYHLLILVCADRHVISF